MGIHAKHTCEVCGYFGADVLLSSGTKARHFKCPGCLAEQKRKREARAERNQKILQMAKMGCDYGDIGSRYGLATETVTNIVRNNDKTKGVRHNFRSTGDLARACFLGS